MKVMCIDTVVYPTWVGKLSKSPAQSGVIYTIRVMGPATNTDLKYFGSYFLDELGDYYPATCFELIDEYRNKKLESIGI